MPNFLSWLFPSRCVVCKQIGSSLCSRCLQTGFRVRSFDWGTVYGCSQYKDPAVRKVLHAYKYEGRKDLAPVLARYMAEIIPEKEYIVVPIPLHWSRYLWRGFNQSALLAQEIARIREWEYQNKLKRTRYTHQQARLPKEERTKNMKNVFVWKGPDLSNKAVLLVDDVCSSGSTLHSAYTALNKEVGGVNAIVFCC